MKWDVPLHLELQELFWERGVNAKTWVCHRWTLEPGPSCLCFCTCEMWIAIQFSIKLAADQMKEYVQSTRKDLAYGTVSWNAIWYCYYRCMCTHCYYYYTQGSLETEMIRKDSGGSCDLERIRGREGQHRQGQQLTPRLESVSNV